MATGDNDKDVISLLLFIAPDSNTTPAANDLNQSMIDDFGHMIKWAKENNAIIHTIIYNSVADQNQNFQTLLKSIPTEYNCDQKKLQPDSNALFIQIAICHFLRDSTVKLKRKKTMIYYTGHGSHICKIERKGFSFRQSMENVCVEHKRHHGAMPNDPNEDQATIPDHNILSSEILNRMVTYIQLHGNSKTIETLAIDAAEPGSQSHCWVEYQDDQLATDIYKTLPDDCVLIMVLDCCHAEGILNTWQCHGEGSTRSKKVVLFAAAVSERRTPTGFTPSFTKHAQRGKQMYKIGKDVADELYENNPGVMYGITKYSIEDLCIEEL